VLSVEQLQYGMMLPSGNDAAYAMAEYFGGLLYERKFKNVSVDKFKFPQNSQFGQTNAKYFIFEMN